MSKCVWEWGEKYKKLNPNWKHVHFDHKTKQLYANVIYLSLREVSYDSQ